MPNMTDSIAGMATKQTPGSAPSPASQGAKSQAACAAATFASTVFSGAVLYLGSPSVEVTREVMRALDITTRMLVVTDDQQLAQRLRDQVDADLRLSTHTQNLSEFVADIAHNEFRLILLSDTDVALTDQTLTMLSPCGIACGLGDTAMPSANAEFTVWHPETSEIAWVLSRRARPVAKRRGGALARRRA